MFRLLIRPTSYTITANQEKQNPYLVGTPTVNLKKAMHQHQQLQRMLHHAYTATSPYSLPDLVFVGNGGLSLPRLPRPTILLPNMKFKQRQDELQALIPIYEQLGLEILPFPNRSLFEGQADLRWFDGGLKAVGGYGHRSTRQGLETVKRLCMEIYQAHSLSVPEFLFLPIESEDYYHTDLALLSYDKSSCLVHRRAFSKKSIQRLQDFLGEGNVHVIDTMDNFCLNAVVEGNRLITHHITPSVQHLLEQITKKTVHMVDTSEFEKSGGSVRCMVLDIYTGKKKAHHLRR